MSTDIISEIKLRDASASPGWFESWWSGTAVASAFRDRRLLLELLESRSGAISPERCQFKAFGNMPCRLSYRHEGPHSCGVP